MRRILLATILCAGTLASVAARQDKGGAKDAARQSTHTHIEDVSREGATRLVLKDSDSGFELDMSYKGVRFNEDYTDVAEVEPGGFLEMRETRAGETRRLEVGREASGSLRYRYRVRGEERAFDADGRAWLARVLKERLHTGFDAEARVAYLYRTGGARAVLDAARQMKTGYARSAYFRHLVKLDGPRDETAAEIIRSAARDEFSDYERAGVLSSIARRPPAGSQSRETFFAAVSKLQSDYERSRVLMTLLRADDLSDEWALAAVRAVSAGSSDYEKARVLVAAARSFGSNRRVIEAVLETSKGIASDYERKRVTSAVEQAGKSATREL